MFFKSFCTFIFLFSFFLVLLCRQIGKNMLRHWTLLSAEEKANTLTHFFPFIATLALAWRLMLDAANASIATPVLNIVGTALFLVGMMLMYASSTLYHWVINPVRKARLRIFDHIAIYAMIAGSYSLICLSVVGGWLGWTLFIFLWVCVIAGAIGKIIALGRYPKLSLALYLAMGWVALIMIVPMWRNMTHAAFFWVFAEGVAYTLGSYFFSKDEEHAYYHAIWHIFIVLGSACHTVATFLILL